MRRFAFLIFFHVLFFYLLPYFSSAQRFSGTNTLQQVIAAVDSFNAKLPAEQLYVHFDKSNYAIGDTVWFKAYLLKRSTHAYSPLNGILYVELISDNNRLIRRLSFPAAIGLSQGQIILDKENIKEGNYFIRAYTNWMQNFGEDFFYNRLITVIDPGSSRWLNKEKNIGILQDKPDPAKRSIIPIVSGRMQNFDLQFMPESGYMVAGINSKVGFKAINESGLGLAVKGKIIDSKNAEVAVLQSFHRGMGSFQFTPAKAERYYAVIDLPAGGFKRFSLPVVKNSGIVLQFNGESNSDSLNVTIRVSPDLVGNNIYHLIALSRGIVCYAANMILRHEEIKARISKAVFPTGVAHFTLLNSSGQPVNERMVFIDHSDNLSITIDTYKNVFSPRDSIPLNIKVADREGKPVTGSFSIAVTDDAQVKTTGLHNESIVSRMLLTTDLKGHVEAADEYFSEEGRPGIEFLMLTQGWVGYDWDKIFKPPVVAFRAERQFSVRGRVTNLTNSPIPKARVILMSSGSRFGIRDTLTNNKGEFVFSNFQRLDSLSFYIDARNARDKKIGIGLTVEQFKPANLSPQTSFPVLPGDVNSDSTIINYALNKQIIENQFQSGGYKKLEEIKIKGKKIIKESFNLNGPGEADHIIDEAEIEKETGKGKNLLQLLTEKVKGFRRFDDSTFRVRNIVVHYIIDGMSLRNFGSTKETLEYLDAEDVKGIEVMYSQAYTGKYEGTFLSFEEQKISGRYVFIEITTRSGNGIFFKKLPGLMIYKPVPITLPVQFYSPKYAVKDIADNTKDLRSTIYWNPSLITNLNGETKTFFYAADNPTTYTVIIQGSDVQGSVGYRMQKMQVVKAIK